MFTEFFKNVAIFIRDMPIYVTISVVVGCALIMLVSFMKFFNGLYNQDTRKKIILPILGFFLAFAIALIITLVK